MEDWNDASINQETPKTANKLQEVRKRQRIPLQVSEGTGPCPHLDLPLPASRTWKQGTTAAEAIQFVALCSGSPSKLRQQWRSHHKLRLINIPEGETFNLWEDHVVGQGLSEHKRSGNAARGACTGTLPDTPKYPRPT